MMVFEDSWCRDTALRCARGVWQRRLVMGLQRWSLSDVIGKARDYKARYYASRRALLARMAARGLSCRECREKDSRGRAIVVLRVGRGLW